MDTPQEISAFFDCIYEHLEKEKDQNIQSKEIQKLEEDLVTSRLASINLNKNFTQNLKSDESNINVKYVALQDRNNYYLKNINILEEKLEQIKTGIEQENRKMSAEAEINLKRQEKLWKRKIEETNNQIQKRKLDHIKKKEKLTSDLTTAQLTNDLEIDEIETALRRELIDLNRKIWRQNEINTDMKKQIEELKKQKKPPSTINIYQDDLLLMNDIEEFFNSNEGNVIKPNKNNHVTDKNKTRMYNSNYHPLDISKQSTKPNYKNLEFIHNNFDNPEPPKTAKQENPKITTNNFDSNPVQFTTPQTNKLDENRTMQNQSTRKRSPDFYNLANFENEKLPLKMVEIKAASKKKNVRGPVQSKNKDGNDGTGAVQKRQTNKRGRPIKRVEDEIKVKDTAVLEQKTVPKKRKMFDPNNHDYLDEMMADYVKDD
ncbi:unnamed protein product [Ceutorhynchus assimilis]|uniref:Uncharacterized protein n=1 Tax=Ceutorhynchus assimilis TaxID=467358 RepID=A0A9N9QCY1_9CUCU|nr:unnamed protein product [Ceutorhynchus assimilis]